MRIPRAALALLKEVARHLLRRPVVGIAALARGEDGRIVLVRRRDTGEWALPGGTLEWGETLKSAIARELVEEAGTRVVELGRVLGVYSRPDRDERFHAVTIVVEAKVGAPSRPPHNPLEIAEVGTFAEHELPATLAHGMTEMLDRARNGDEFWE